MKASLLTLVLVLALPTGHTRLPAADGLDPVVWEKAHELEQRAGGYYQKREYQKAIEVYRRLLEMLPAGPAYDRLRSQSWYSLATSHALLGKEKDAVAALEKAVEAGLTDPRALDRNSDFDSIRRGPAFAAVRDKMARKVDEADRGKLEELKRFDFQLTTVDGKPISKKDLAGHVVLVDIWGTWCEPCRMQIPHLSELFRRYGPAGLRVVGLSSEKTKDPAEAARLVERCIQRYRIPYPCALATDEVLKSIPGPLAYPTTLFFGRDGLPRKVEVGYRDLEALEEVVKRLLAEPRGAKPDSGKSAAGKPARGKSDSAKSESAKSDSAKPGNAESASRP